MILRGREKTSSAMTVPIGSPAAPNIRAQQTPVKRTAARKLEAVLREQFVRHGQSVGRECDANTEKRLHECVNRFGA